LFYGLVPVEAGDEIVGGRGETEKLVIEPFANPFRVHPLLKDCDQFRKLFRLGCECYIMNTHAFGIGDDIVDIPKELSLKIIKGLIKIKSKKRWIN